METAYEKLCRIGWDVNPSGCWLFRGRPTNHGGYGSFWHGGKHLKAHRVVCAEVHGLPDELGALHSCHTPLCVRPDHLRPGTHRQNMQDKVEAGRQYVPPCPAGHDLTLPGATKNYANGSRCVECRRARARRYWTKKNVTASS